MRLNYWRRDGRLSLRFSLAMNDCSIRPSGWIFRRQCMLVMGVWLFFCLFNTLNSYIDLRVAGKNATWGNALGYPVASYGMWSLLTLPILLFARNVRSHTLSRLGWTTAHLACAILVMALASAGWMLVPSWI